MKQSETTARFAQPFAAQADANLVAYPLPDIKKENGRLSLLKGFPVECFTALSAGGVPPSGADFNGILRTLSEAIRSSEAGQIRPFEASYAAQISGYPKGALVCAPSDPSRLFISTRDDNLTDPTDDMSESWLSLTDTIKTLQSDLKQTVSGVQQEKDRAQNAEAQLVSEVQGLDAAKLNRTGDTVSGDLIYQSETAVAAWASTPQVSLRFQGSKARGALFGQIRGDGNFQTLLYAQNIDGVNKAWGFRSDDGHVATPNDHTLLEADDTGNGRVTIQNIGSASGKTLALLDDVIKVEAQTISGISGLTAGDHKGVGLHTEGNNNAVLYKDDVNAWRHLVVGDGNNTDAAVKAVVFSAGANGDRSGPVFIDTSGNYINLLPATNPTVNGVVTTTLGTTLPEIIGGGSRKVIQTFLAKTAQVSSGTVSFPTAFKPGTQPFVFLCPVTEHGSLMSSVSDVKQNQDGSLQITNTGFNFYRMTGGHDSTYSYTIPVLAIGDMQ